MNVWEGKSREMSSLAQKEIRDGWRENSLVLERPVLKRDEFFDCVNSVNVWAIVNGEFDTRGLRNWGNEMASKVWAQRI